MFTAEIVLAAALLSAPPASSEPPLLAPSRIPEDRPAVAAFAEVLRPNILALALAGEILDPREKGFVMGQDLLGDLDMLRGRRIQYAAAPLIDEAHRFPDRKFTNEALAINRSLRLSLLKLGQLDGGVRPASDAAIDECNRLYQVWDAVRDSRCDYYYVTVRRDALVLLRALLGHEAFYSGRLPPPVPQVR